MTDSRLAVLVLAAGQGTRMKSALPKVLHRIANRPIIQHVLAAVAPLQLLPVIFALIFTPLIFTGCTFYPWASLNAITWYQVLTLFNPLTYASEGMRYAMIPPVHGQAQPTLAMGWIVLTLCSLFIVSLWGGIIFFRRRVIS